MPFFHHDSDQAQAHNEYNDLNPVEHKAKFSHELIAGAAAYQASKAYSDHKAKNGEFDDHAKAKAFIAGAIGAFVDREVETKGLDFIDKQKAKHHAKYVLVFLFSCHLVVPTVCAPSRRCPPVHLFQP
ncbi:uncharacterized protein EI90DRAFT_2998458 [Cantharellus anzutake]|uniref:uncharacterized protein n=1 Tax=Cantharellus anzutake TaxID=1750568 RepID=UPI001906C128|nr:uncharacterized protein EI90DRAFT_2998458 [Cantharellus anzutake]KAF8327550.1 hypothetical protein EI90DRAFT_2998458 [Cantharellus anzutake]